MLAKSRLPSRTFGEQPTSVELLQFHQVLGGERIDQIAALYYGEPTFWRAVAEFNQIGDPFELVAGQILRIPNRAIVEEYS